MDGKINYFITDVDRVILDRMAAIIEAFAKAMRHFDVPEKQVVSYLRGSLGAPFESQVKGILAETGRTVSDEEIRQARRHFWGEFNDTEIKLFPGVKDTLDELKSRGVTILASTGSKTSEIKHLFAKFFLPSDFILGSDKILKGDEHIKIFAERFSLPKTDFCRQAAFVGDGTVDMQIAARNGIFGIGITNSIAAQPLIAAGAEAIIGNFQEVIKLLKQCNN